MIEKLLERLLGIPHNDRGPIYALVEYIVNHGGLFLLMFIIFAETGLFAGFFLPGDSLLFVAGIFMKQFAASLFGGTADSYAGAAFHWHYLIILSMVAAAGIIGNLVGYWFGKKGGPLLYQRKDTLLFKKKHLKAASKFFDQHGSKAIILGRFIPIVRTFAPIVAGIVVVDYKKFVKDSIVGAIAWVFSMMLAGYFLQDLFMRAFDVDLSKHIEKIAIGIIVVTTAPVIWKAVMINRQKDDDTEAEA
jgi:membrane-associated protein